MSEQIIRNHEDLLSDWERMFFEPWVQGSGSKTGVFSEDVWKLQLRGSQMQGQLSARKSQQISQCDGIDEHIADAIRALSNLPRDDRVTSLLQRSEKCKKHADKLRSITNDY